MIISSLILLAKIFHKEDNLKHTLPVALAAGEDKSWRMLLQFAKNFPDLTKSFGKDIVKSSLIQTVILRCSKTEKLKSRKKPFSL